MTFRGSKCLYEFFTSNHAVEYSPNINRQVVHTMHTNKQKSPPRNYYEIAEVRGGVTTRVWPMIFERRIDAIEVARDLKRKGIKVRVRSLPGPRYMRR